MGKAKALEAFARYVEDGGKLCLVDCGVREKQSKRLCCTMFQGDDEQTQLDNAALMAQARRMRGILERMLEYDFKGNLLGVRAYNGCLEDIQDVLRRQKWEND